MINLKLAEKFLIITLCFNLFFSFLLKSFNSDEQLSNLLVLFNLLLFVFLLIPVIIKNNNLSCLQFEDFNLEVNISGEKIPANVFIEIDNNRFSLVKDNITDFHFLFKNINKDIVVKYCN